jgi:hypothetical protein
MKILKYLLPVALIVAVGALFVTSALAAPPATTDLCNPGGQLVSVPNPSGKTVEQLLEEKNAQGQGTWTEPPCNPPPVCEDENAVNYGEEGDCEYDETEECPNGDFNGEDEGCGEEPTGNGGGNTTTTTTQRDICKVEVAYGPTHIGRALSVDLLARYNADIVVRMRNRANDTIQYYHFVFTNLVDRDPGPDWLHGYVILSGIDNGTFDVSCFYVKPGGFTTTWDGFPVSSVSQLYGAVGYFPVVEILDHGQ